LRASVRYSVSWFGPYNSWFGPYNKHRNRLRGQQILLRPANLRILPIPCRIDAQRPA